MRRRRLEAIMGHDASGSGTSVAVASATPAGKVCSAIRAQLDHGRYPPSTLYGDGRVSERVLDLFLYAEGSDVDLADEEFVQSWTYTDLGRVLSRLYPRCTAGFAKCNTDTGGGWRTVTNTYDRGYLTAIPGYASEITYHPNGLVNEIWHTNGIRVTQEADPDGMTRPASITARMTSSVW